MEKKLPVNEKFVFCLMTGIIVTILGLAACASAATPVIQPTEPPIEETEGPTAVPPRDVAESPTATPEPAIGSAEHPIKVLFVPTVETATIVTGGEAMTAALKGATGLEFIVSVPNSYLATIEAMCASPTDTIGFIPAIGYVFANQLCGVDVAFKAVHYKNSVYWTQFLVARDSNIQTIQDLEGKKWGYTEPTSASGYMVPLVMMKEAGVKPGESIETGSHPQSVKAIYNGEVDFSTSFYTPPLKPEGEPAWVEGDPPDVPDELVASCAPTADEKALMCGDWRILDARTSIRTEAPDVIQKVRIAFISPEIPNDTISFGPEFPAELRKQISEALIAFSQTDGWTETIGSQDFYNWTGIDVATDSEYDFVRKMVEVAGVTLENLGQ